jgi:hypothetical protein
LTWKAAVPAGQYAEHSCPRIVRHGKAAPLQPELLGPLLGEVQRRVPPAQDVGGGVRGGRRERLQDEALGVPERVPVVARSGQPLGRHRPPLGAGAGLQDVEQPEAHGLLHDGVAVDLDVGAVPVVVEVGALAREQALPAAVAGAGERRRDLVAHRRHRAHARPAVGEELHDPQHLARPRPQTTVVRAQSARASVSSVTGPAR